MSSDSIYIFDADGVAIHPWGFANALENEFGISTENTKAFFSGAFKRCLTGEADIEVLLPEFLGSWGWSGSTEQFIDFWLKSDDQPNAEILERVDQLRSNGHRCYLASNQERRRAEYINSQMGFGRRFDKLFFSCDLGFTKPDRRFFDTIAAEISGRSSTITFWDDSEVYVAAAVESGWEAVRYAGIHSVERVCQEAGDKF